GPSPSPKDRSKVSINFLSSEHTHPDSSNRARSPPSPLSTRARGVNRPLVFPQNFDDVRLEIEAASSSSRTYRLEIVQHPDRTAESGASTLTRLPLAPPLIVQLHMRTADGRDVTDEAEFPFLVAQLSLLNGEGGAPMDYAAGDVDGRERLLYGSLVSSPQILNNLRGHRGMYFLFPDVAVRRLGRFQLKVVLIRMPQLDEPTMLAQRRSPTIVAAAQSLPFEVQPRGGYVAPAQTPLTQYFLQQGARMYA
ncbi:velvet factor-domain-containing protein, partial [Epithele typhae]|uniref:velvet factor-domain-containing protein n=1 Tax=Epithele typhae TaxID=378194 RepID=UPI002007BC5F